MSEAHETLPHASGTLSIWSSILGAPAIWALHLQINYALVPWACRSKRLWVLHVVTLLCLVLTALGGMPPWRQWRKASGKDPHYELIARDRFLAVLGLMVTSLFFLVILATGIASFIIEPCVD
jgi:hypothetical protein